MERVRIWKGGITCHQIELERDGIEGIIKGRRKLGEANL